MTLKAEIYAKIIGLQNARQNQAVGEPVVQSPNGTPQGIPPISKPDNSGVGNGTIGTGGVPQTEMEFTGTINPTGQN